MRSFLGRDILSLKDWERAEYFRVFEVCEELAPIVVKDESVIRTVENPLSTRPQFVYRGKRSVPTRRRGGPTGANAGGLARLYLACWPRRSSAPAVPITPAG